MNDCAFAANEQLDSTPSMRRESPSCMQFLACIHNLTILNSFAQEYLVLRSFKTTYDQI
jgi:hypothetical protein